MLFSFATICQLGYYVFSGSLYMSVLVTFTLSLTVIFALQLFKKILFSEASVIKKLTAGIPLVISVAAVYVFNMFFEVDYGFIGCTVPVAASLFDMRGVEGAPEFLKKLDNILIRVLAMSIPLLLFSLLIDIVQIFSLFALLLLLLYSGKRGRFNMKYFFYAFYPSHLVILEGIALVLKYAPLL